MKGASYMVARPSFFLSLAFIAAITGNVEVWAIPWTDVWRYTTSRSAEGTMNYGFSVFGMTDGSGNPVPANINADSAPLSSFAAVYANANGSVVSSVITVTRPFHLGEAPSGWNLIVSGIVNGNLNNIDCCNAFGGRPTPHTELSGYVEAMGRAGAQVPSPARETFFFENPGRGDFNRLEVGKEINLLFGLLASGDYSVSASLTAKASLSPCDTCSTDITGEKGPPQAATNGEDNRVKPPGAGLLVSITPLQRSAMPIAALATGSRTPPVIAPPVTSATQVSNGDFLITANGFDPGGTLSLGDGSDELTSWTFDLEKIQNSDSFRSRCH